MGKVCSKKALWKEKVLCRCPVVFIDPYFRDLQYFNIVIHTIVTLTIINTNMVAIVCWVLLKMIPPHILANLIIITTS